MIIGGTLLSLYLALVAVQTVALPAVGASVALLLQGRKPLLLPSSDEEEEEDWWQNQTNLPPHDPEPEPEPEFQAEQQEFEEKQQEYEKTIHAYDFRLRDVVEELVGHVQFVTQRRFIGHEIHLREVEGIQLREVRYPADDFLVRPIQAGNLAELSFLLPSERALPPSIRKARFLAGDALVRMPAEAKPLTEEIHVPQYKTHMQVLYVLWDVSPSMFPDHDKWRRPVWQALLLRLQDKALRSEVPLYVRPFGSGVGDLIVSKNAADALAFRDTVMAPPWISGTDIDGAIQWAISDFSSVEYDEGDVVIITDGEDNRGLNTSRIRRALGNARLRLHSIMLGVENDKLRECSDVYQIVEEDLTVHPPIYAQEVAS